MRTRRRESSSGIYHVMARGTGRQNIFEGDADRTEFLSILDEALDRSGVILYAWCLMSNHVHLLLQGALGDVSTCMKRLCGIYAQRFNQRTGRVGHLFQERYKSEPVEDDAYLLTVVRYIHDNPVKGKLSDMESYTWSSYKEYLGAPGHCSTDFVLAAFGGRDSFVRFHEDESNAGECLDVTSPNSRGRTRAMPDDVARETAAGVLDDVGLDDLKSLPRSVRNEYIRRLKGAGLSIRQIERLTGIGRNRATLATRKLRTRLARAAESSRMQLLLGENGTGMVEREPPVGAEGHAVAHAVEPTRRAGEAGRALEDHRLRRVGTRLREVRADAIKLMSTQDFDYKVTLTI